MVAIPVKTNKEDPAISPLFGHAKWFAFVDEEGNVEIKRNPFDGGINVVSWLLQGGVDKVITKHIGRKPFMLLSSEGVKCYYPGEERITVKEALQKCQKKECEEITLENLERFLRH